MKLFSKKKKKNSLASTSSSQFDDTIDNEYEIYGSSELSLIGRSSSASEWINTDRADGLAPTPFRRRHTISVEIPVVRRNSGIPPHITKQELIKNLCVS